MQPIKKGDLAIIIEGALGKTGPNIGKQVTVGMRVGEHSKYGNIWRVHAEGLITEYGAVGSEVDCAQSWLLKDFDACNAEKVVGPDSPVLNHADNKEEITE